MSVLSWQRPQRHGPPTHIIKILSGSIWSCRTYWWLLQFSLEVYFNGQKVSDNIVKILLDDDEDVDNDDDSDCLIYYVYKRIMIIFEATGFIFIGLLIYINFKIFLKNQFQFFSILPDLAHLSYFSPNSCLLLHHLISSILGFPLFLILSTSYFSSPNHHHLSITSIPATWTGSS